MPRAAKEILFIAGAVLVALALVELGLRLAGIDPGKISPHFDVESASSWSQTDARLGWRNRPGAARSSECGQFTMNFREDSSRNAPSEPDTLPSVLFFGASYVQGYGVPDEDTFVEQLNRTVPGRGFRSYGTGGYNTLQSRLLAEEVLAGRPPGQPPARVVYGFTQGDTGRNVARGSNVVKLRGPGGRFAVPPHLRISDGKERLLPAEHIEAWPGAQHLAIAVLLQRTAILARFRSDEAESFAASRRLAEQFADAMEARGLRFDVVIFDSEDAVRDAVFGDSSLNPIDCRYEDRPELTVCGDGRGHPGAQVHAYWAKCVLDHLSGPDTGPRAS
ncbi:MAG: hypothetical protein ACR2P8_12330 [Myxococcota bacterium]